MDPVSFGLGLTPRGHLILSHEAEPSRLDRGLAERLVRAFERGAGHGLLLLGADEAGTLLPPVYGYWREFGARYVTAICMHQDSGRIHRAFPGQRAGPDTAEARSWRY